ncbi:hypothetical protein D3C87_1847750 [compost metagenome]
MAGRTWKAKMKPKVSILLTRSPKMKPAPTFEKSRSLVTPAPSFSKIRWPTGVLRTNKARNACIPRPQPTTLRLMALRLVESR